MIWFLIGLSVGIWIAANLNRWANRFEAWRERQAVLRKWERELRNEVDEATQRFHVASVTDLRTGQRSVYPNRAVAGDKLTRDEIAAILERPSYEERR